MKRPPPSLQARALGWLAQREHSRSELRRKLLRHAERAAQASPFPADAVGPIDATDTVDPGDPADLADPVERAERIERIERLLDTLQAQGLLSEERFVASRVRLRAPRMGTRRIQGELARHGLKLPPQSLQQLRDSELQRATQLWRRRFGIPAIDAKERARQQRFLAGRGFGGDIIGKVLGTAGRGADGGADDEAA